MTSSGGSGKPPGDPPDDLRKPASEVGWAEAAKRAGVEHDPAAPRRPSAAAKPADAAKPTVARPADAPPTVAKPADAPPTVARPADAAKPAEPAKAVVEPATEAKPEALAVAATKPAADAKPADAKPADAKPADAKPADAKPADAKPADAKPADAKPADAKPADASRELLVAVGATPVVRRRRPAEVDDHDDDDGAREGRSLKSIATIGAGIAAVLAIAIFVVLGRLNVDHYALTCEAERAVPQQGRAFPPWGYHALAGDAWRPLKIAAETRCQSREADDALVLERWFLAMILDQVTLQLTSRDPIKLDETDALLKQGLLLTRPPATPEAETFATERTARHKDIERMLGDVTYWRAAIKLRDAATVLSDAAKQFDTAAAQRPRHVSDATAWAAYARKLSEQLRVGPAGGAPPSLVAPTVAPAAATTVPDVAAEATAPPRPPAPQGTALPVEPDKAHDAPEPARPEPVPPAPASPVSPPSSGGVLL